MKRTSLQWKLTVWFSSALILMAALSFTVVFLVSHAVLQKTVRDELIRTVEDNVDEVEYFRNLVQPDRDNDDDQYIRYGAGYLEIDDDYLDSVNGVMTALYRADGELLYGENPIATVTADLSFSDGVWRSVRSDGEIYYVYDRSLGEGTLRGLWLRGVVSETQTDAQLRDIIYTCLWVLGALVLVAIVGGVLIARHALRPVRDMARAAAQISGGDDLKKRIPISGGDELARLGTAFNGMIERLDEAFEAERQFTSDASHELRTPMTVILAQCDETLGQAATPEVYRDALLVIRRQGRRMNRIISGMLELLRMERKADLYARDRFDLSELAECVCEDMALIREKGITLEHEIEPGIEMVGDPMLLTRMLNNLISNAYRYGKDNGHIRVTLHRDSNDILLSVTDDGIGIAPEQCEKIFHRLYQAAADRSGDGVGLGLSMARQIAQLHGGTLDVQSEIGLGSVFTARFRSE